MSRRAAHFGALPAAFLCVLSGFTVLVGALGTALTTGRPLDAYLPAEAAGALLLAAGLALGAWALHRLRR
jgi:cytochrome b subunit of formate dehydrogenase